MSIPPRRRTPAESILAGVRVHCRIVDALAQCPAGRAQPSASIAPVTVGMIRRMAGMRQPLVAAHIDAARADGCHTANFGLEALNGERETKAAGLNRLLQALAPPE